ncbi:MAG: YkvA family protein [Elusimicrobiota bacterium]
MNYGQARDLFEKSGLSPESAAAELGVSGMTLRRWREKPREEEVPEIYRLAMEPLLRRLISEGVLHPEDVDATAAFAGPQQPFQKTLKELGISMEALDAPATSGAIVTKGLAAIGGNEQRQEQVKRSGKMLARLKEMGAEWRGRIEDLTTAVNSKEINALDKLVAFGALFYLICPFDLIPDALPVIGFADDFIVLGIAVLYYRKRFPHLFPDRKKKQAKAS